MHLPEMDSGSRVTRWHLLWQSCHVIARFHFVASKSPDLALLLHHHHLPSSLDHEDACICPGSEPALGSPATPKHPSISPLQPRRLAPVYARLKGTRGEQQCVRQDRVFHPLLQLLPYSKTLSCTKHLIHFLFRVVVVFPLP